MVGPPRDPFWGREIAVPSHHPDPYWGLPTAHVDWCEANYAHSRYVAEFWNTLSSVPMVIVSLRGLWLCWHYQMEPRFYFCWLAIGVVGIGSIAFHGTLLPAGQATDELAMVWGSMAFLYVALEAGHKEARPARWWLPLCEVLYSLAFSFSYFSLPNFFPVFIVSYGCTVLLVIYQSFRIYKQFYTEDKSTAGIWQRRLFAFGGLGYPFAFLFFWVPENLFCPFYPWLFQTLNLHAWFHLITTASPYSVVVFMTYDRCRERQRRAEHRLGSLGLAYVHVFKDAP